MKLKTNTSLLVLYVCYWPGLEDRSSGPGIVSRSLSRGEFVSLSSKHGFFLAREKSSSTLGVSRTASVSGESCKKNTSVPVLRAKKVRPSCKPKKKSEFSENFQKICNPKKSPFLEFQRIFRKFSENRLGISKNRQFSITSHERDDMC